MADQGPQPKLETERSEDFENIYANNVLFESTLWDLKLLLGQTDLAASKVVQHTSLALPWPQAKVAAYFMTVNMIIQQSQTGVINIPKEVLPPRPDPSERDLDENGKRVVKYLGWIYDQFFGSNPYVPPELADPAVVEQPTT